MKLLFLSSVTSSGYAYARGQKADVNEPDATRLIMSGAAVKLVPTPSVEAAINAALAADFSAAGYRVLPSGWTPDQPLPSGWFIPPSGVSTATVVPSGYVLPSGAYSLVGDAVHVVSPAGVRVSFDLLGLRP